MKKILFPTDFTTTTEKAFVYALNLAQQLNASITTLHAYKKPDVGDFVMPSSLSSFYEGLDWDEFENYKHAIPSLQKIAIENHLEAVTVNHGMIEGETVDVITKVAKEEGYDLIVMGTEGASILKEIFIGSYAGEVMEIAACPVIVIPEHAEFDGKIDKIGIAIDFSPEGTKVIDKVLHWANALDAMVEGIHIDIAHTGGITHKMDSFKADYAKEDRLTFVELEGSDIVETIARYAEANHIDMLVMVTHQRNFLQELFNFSHAKKMTYQQKIPVFAIPENIL